MERWNLDMSELSGFIIWLNPEERFCPPEKRNSCYWECQSCQLGTAVADVPMPRTSIDDHGKSKNN
jgi:hypothetical protein